jgi:hypothetical protein
MLRPEAQLALTRCVSPAVAAGADAGTGSGTTTAGATSALAATFGANGRPRTKLHVTGTSCWTHKGPIVRTLQPAAVHLLTIIGAPADSTRLSGRRRHGTCAEYDPTGGAPKHQSRPEMRSEREERARNGRKTEKQAPPTRACFSIMRLASLGTAFQWERRLRAAASTPPECVIPAERAS